LCSVLRPHQHSIGYMGDGFYRSKDPTNSIKVLKENLQKKTTQRTKKTQNTHAYTQNGKTNTAYNYNKAQQAAFSSCQWPRMVNRPISLLWWQCTAHCVWTSVNAVLKSDKYKILRFCNVTLLTHVIYTAAWITINYFPSC